jgi:segregation and condensation protein B
MKIEAILFSIAKPISLDRLQKHFKLSKEELLVSVEDIKTRFNKDSSGIHLLFHENKLQFVTNPKASDHAEAFLKKQASGPLTRASLETLTVIAYRGPITRPEIEQIRGINCGIILRNLLIRGFIDEVQDVEKLQKVYSVSIKFIQKLGLKDISDLPDYESFKNNIEIDELIDKIGEEETV